MSGLPPDFDPAQVQTTRQAKKAWRKSGGVKRLSASQVRAIDRREARQKKAAQQSEAEERRKESKRKREEKELKEREAKLRQVQEGKLKIEDTWGKVTASQPRLNTFFNRQKQSPKISRLRQVESANRRLLDQIASINEAFETRSESETEDSLPLQSLSQTSLHRKRKACDISDDDETNSSGTEDSEEKENSRPSQSSSHTLDFDPDETVCSRRKKVKREENSKCANLKQDTEDEDETLAAEGVASNNEDSERTLADESYPKLGHEGELEDSLGDYLQYPAQDTVSVSASKNSNIENIHLANQNVQVVRFGPATTNRQSDIELATTRDKTDQGVQSQIPDIAQTTNTCIMNLDDETLEALYAPLTQKEPASEQFKVQTVAPAMDLDDDLLEALYEPLTQDNSAEKFSDHDTPGSTTLTNSRVKDYVPPSQGRDTLHGKPKVPNSNSKDFAKSASFAMDGYDDDDLLEALEAFEAEQQISQQSVSIVKRRGRPLPWNVHPPPTPYSIEDYSNGDISDGDSRMSQWGETST